MTDFQYIVGKHTAMGEYLLKANALFAEEQIYNTDETGGDFMGIFEHQISRIPYQI